MREGNGSISQGRNSSVEQNSCCCGCVVCSVCLHGLMAGRLALVWPCGLNIYSWLGKGNQVTFYNSSVVSAKAQHMETARRVAPIPNNLLTCAHPWPQRAAFSSTGTGSTSSIVFGPSISHSSYSSGSLPAVPAAQPTKALKSITSSQPSSHCTLCTAPLCRLCLFLSFSPSWRKTKY